MNSFWPSEDCAENLIHLDFVSSCIFDGYYDVKNQKLYLLFRAGWYRYENVPKVMINQFLLAPSKGRFFNSSILGRFIYVSGPNEKWPLQIGYNSRTFGFPKTEEQFKKHIQQAQTTFESISINSTQVSAITDYICSACDEIENDINCVNVPPPNRIQFATDVCRRILTKWTEVEQLMISVDRAMKDLTEIKNLAIAFASQHQGMNVERDRANVLSWYASAEATFKETKRKKLVAFQKKESAFAYGLFHSVKVKIESKTPIRLQPRHHILLSKNDTIQIYDGMTCPAHHRMVPQSVSIFFITTTGQIKCIQIDCRVCPDCGELIYYIPEHIWNVVSKEGVPLCKVNEYIRAAPIDISGWSVESLLHRFGYNVSQTSNLYPGQRRAILRFVVEAGIYSKSELISFLTSQRNLRLGVTNKNFESAIARWTSDIDYLYKTELVRSLEKLKSEALLYEWRENRLARIYPKPVGIALLPAKTHPQKVISGAKVWSQDFGQGVVGSSIGSHHIEICFDGPPVERINYDITHLPDELFILENHN